VNPDGGLRSGQIWLQAWLGRTIDHDSSLPGGLAASKLKIVVAFANGAPRQCEVSRGNLLGSCLGVGSVAAADEARERRDGSWRRSRQCRNTAEVSLSKAVPYGSFGRQSFSFRIGARCGLSKMARTGMHKPSYLT